MLERTSKPEWYAKGLKFECTQCGNCCTGAPGYVWFDDDEARAIAEHLGVSVEEFRRDHAHAVFNRWTLNEQWNASSRGYDCVFLRRDAETGKALCSIYAVRPTQCRTWPFWPENLRSAAAWRRAASGCPGMNKGDFYPIEKVRIIRGGTPHL